MRAFARKGALRSGASYVSTTHWPAQHYRAQEYSVALLGVMYPCAVQHCHDGPEHLEPTLPPEILIPSTEHRPHLLLPHPYRCRPDSSANRRTNTGTSTPRKARRREACKP